jgi:hypothetical protein
MKFIGNLSIHPTNRFERLFGAHKQKLPDTHLHRGVSVVPGIFQSQLILFYHFASIG